SHQTRLPGSESCQQLPPECASLLLGERDISMGNPVRVWMGRNCLLNAFLPQNMDHRKRRAVGIVGGILRLTAVETIVRVEAGELEVSFHTTVLQPQLGQRQEVQVVIEITQSIGENQQRRLRCRVFHQCLHLRCQRQQQGFWLLLLTRHEGHPARVQLACCNQRRVIPTASALMTSSWAWRHLPAAVCSCLWKQPYLSSSPSSAPYRCRAAL